VASKGKRGRTWKVKLSRESGRKDPKGQGKPKVERGEGKPISLLADRIRKL
jgi:hypothetical protein